MSLIGGWRQGDVTVLRWQMNAAGYAKLSIGTAMRSYFVEHEVQRGSWKLIDHEGTPHSMANSLARKEAIALLIRRHSVRATLIARRCIGC